MGKELANSELKKIIDKMHDEIVIFNNDYKVVYSNCASIKHYGLLPKDLTGKHFSELDGIFWKNATLPIVYKTKKTTTKKQVTNLGHIILTTSVPIFDDDGNLKYVVQNVNDLSHINHTLKDEKVLSGFDDSISKTPERYLSKKMKSVYSTIESIKNIKSPCLILGETGTGKSYLAKYIHSTSNRKDKPFFSLNCGAINSNLLESELFGYKKGAFSGANTSGKKGIVEVADGGILFLDEISEIPYDLQSKLLSFLQDQEFIAVGGIEKQKVDVRIIAATNRNLESMVENHNFRKDLFFRLNTFEITLPPLRERSEDIVFFVNYFLNVYNNVYEKDRTIGEKVIELLREYPWPGNIRELSHLIEKMVVLSKEKEIKTNDLPTNLFKIQNSNIEGSIEIKNLDLMIEELEKKTIVSVYKKYKSSVKVAKALEISQPRAYRLIQKYIKDKCLRK